MHTNTKAGAHQGCDPFEEGQIPINIVPYDADSRKHVSSCPSSEQYELDGMLQH
jgi:hypothetical protein